MKTTSEVIALIAIAIIRAERIFGSATKLAEAIGVTRQRLNYWKQNELLPLEMAIRIFVATYGKVSLFALRPDLKELMKKMISILFVQALGKVSQMAQSAIESFL